MTIIKTYSDLCHEIDFYRERIRQLKQELKSLTRMCFTLQEVKGQNLSGISVQSTRQIGFDDYLNRSGKIKKEIATYKKHLDVLKHNKKELDERLRNYDGLEYKIIYKRLVENKKHEQIAEELHYSEAHIKRLWMHMSKAE